MNKKTIYEAIQMQAVSDILSQTDVHFFRKVCRWYSKNFHTPLHQVMDGSVVLWDEVLLHYYESQMEELSYNQLYDLAVNEYVPELSEILEEENQEFANALIEEQKRTIAKKKAKMSNNNQKTIVTGVKEEKPHVAPQNINFNFEDEGVE
jgi:hypothetical protein